MMDLIDTTIARSCACANIRQTDLVVSQFYDGVLASSGLYAIQFGMLGVITNLAPTTVNHLARAMDMDRATVNRHLKILTDRELIRFEGEDQHTRQILLTDEGEQVLKRAWPLWQEAQDHIERTFGRERFKAFLSELEAIRTLLSAGIS